MEGDEVELLALFQATSGMSQILEDRVSGLNKMGDIEDPNVSATQRRKSCNVVFTMPPDMISTADEALTFNLKYGRYDDCFEHRKFGPMGEGYYVTELGRRIGERLKLQVKLSNLQETAPTVTGSSHRFFVKKRSNTKGGKEIPEARYIISKEHVIDLPSAQSNLPVLSRWNRLDGWVYDSLKSSFKHTASAPLDERMRQQRQMLRSDITGWFGVEVRDNRVAALELPHNNLIGSFPRKFPSKKSNLSHLQLLDLSNNQINGEIPSSLANMKSLTALDLSENSLRGMLPNTLSKTLRSLNLRGNFLSGQIHGELLDVVTDLRILILTENQFEGILPCDHLMKLKKLEKLDIAQNIGIYGSLSLLFIHRTLSKLKHYDFAGTSLCSMDMSNEKQSIHELLEEEAENTALSVEIPKDNVGVGPWLDACVEAELLKAGQNIMFLRARKAKRNKDAMRRSQPSKHADKLPEAGEQSHQPEGRSTNSVSGSKGGGSVSSANRAVDMFDSAAAHETQPRDIKKSIKSGHSTGSGGDVDNTNVVTGAVAVMLPPPSSPLTPSSTTFSPPRKATSRGGDVYNRQNKSANENERDDFQVTDNNDKDDDNSIFGYNHDGNESLELELEEGWSPEGGWSRWARLFVKARKGKRRGQLTFEEERCLDARLLGRLPTLVNHIVFHHSSILDMKKLCLQDPFFSEDTPSAEAGGFLSPMKRKLKPGTILEHGTSAKAANNNPITSGHVLPPSSTNSKPKWLDMIGCLPFGLASLLPGLVEINLQGHQISGKIGPALEVLEEEEQEEEQEQEDQERVPTASFHAVATVTTAFKPHAIKGSQLKKKEVKFPDLKLGGGGYVLSHQKRGVGSSSVKSGGGSVKSGGSGSINKYIKASRLPSLASNSSLGRRSEHGDGGEEDDDESDCGSDDSYENEVEDEELEKARQEKLGQKVNSRHYIYPEIQLTNQRSEIINKNIKSFPTRTIGHEKSWGKHPFSTGGQNSKKEARHASTTFSNDPAIYGKKWGKVDADKRGIEKSQHSLYGARYTTPTDILLSTKPSNSKVDFPLENETSEGSDNEVKKRNTSADLEFHETRLQKLESDEKELKVLQDMEKYRQEESKKFMLSDNDDTKTIVVGNDDDLGDENNNEKEEGKMDTAISSKSDIHLHMPNNIDTNINEMKTIHESESANNIPKPLVPSFYHSLKILNLSCNKLTGKLPSSLSKLKVLEVLKLDGNQLTGPIITTEIASNMPCLSTLELSSNQLTGVLQKCLDIVKTMPNLKSLGWGSNQMTGNFGNYLGDDDDEISLLFPFEGLTASETHFNAYGSFADPSASSAMAAAHASSRAKKSNQFNGVETDHETDTIHSGSDTKEGNSSTHSGSKSRHSIAAGSDKRGSQTFGPSKKLILKRATARQGRRIELIGRRKWITSLKYLRLGGNVGLYGSLPPILLVLKMQGRLLLDINGCGLDVVQLEDGVNYDIDSDNSSDEDNGSSDESTSDDGNENVENSGLAARRRLMRKLENKERREKRKQAASLARKMKQSEDNRQGFAVSKHTFQAYSRGRVLHLKHFAVLASAARKAEMNAGKLYKSSLLLAEQATRERIKLMGDDFDEDTRDLLQGKLYDEEDFEFNAGHSDGFQLMAAEYVDKCFPKQPPPSSGGQVHAKGSKEDRMWKRQRSKLRRSCEKLGRLEGQAYKKSRDCLLAWQKAEENAQFCELDAQSERAKEVCYKSQVLDVVDMAGCSLYSFPVKGLVQALPLIKEIHLPRNKIVGSLLRFLQRLASLRHLQVLDLSHNKLHGCFISQAKPLLGALAVLAPPVNQDGSINTSLQGSVGGYLNGSLKVFRVNGNPKVRGVMTEAQAHKRAVAQKAEHEAFLKRQKLEAEEEAARKKKEAKELKLQQKRDKRKAKKLSKKSPSPTVSRKESSRSSSREKSIHSAGSSDKGEREPIHSSRVTTASSGGGGSNFNTARSESSDNGTNSGAPHRLKKKSSINASDDDSSLDSDDESFGPNSARSHRSMRVVSSGLSANQGPPSPIDHSPLPFSQSNFGSNSAAMNDSSNDGNTAIPTIGGSNSFKFNLNLDQARLRLNEDSSSVGSASTVGSAEQSSNSQQLGLAIDHHHHGLSSANHTPKILQSPFTPSSTGGSNGGGQKFFPGNAPQETPRMGMGGGASHLRHKQTGSDSGNNSGNNSAANSGRASSQEGGGGSNQGGGGGGNSEQSPGPLPQRFAPLLETHLRTTLIECDVYIDQQYVPPPTIFKSKVKRLIHASRAAKLFSSAGNESLRPQFEKEEEEMMRLAAEEQGLSSRRGKSSSRRNSSSSRRRRSITPNRDQTRSVSTDSVDAVVEIKGDDSKIISSSDYNGHKASTHQETVTSRVTSPTTAVSSPSSGLQRRGSIGSHDSGGGGVVRRKSISLESARIRRNSLSPDVGSLDMNGDDRSNGSNYLRRLSISSDTGEVLGEDGLPLPIPITEGLSAAIEENSKRKSELAAAVAVTVEVLNMPPLETSASSSAEGAHVARDEVGNIEGRGPITEDVVHQAETGQTSTNQHSVNGNISTTSSIGDESLDYRLVDDTAIAENLTSSNFIDGVLTDANVEVNLPPINIQVGGNNCFQYLYLPGEAGKLAQRVIELTETLEELEADLNTRKLRRRSDEAEEKAVLESKKDGSAPDLYDLECYVMSTDLLFALNRFPSHEELTRYIRHQTSTFAAAAEPHADAGKTVSLANHKAGVKNAASQFELALQAAANAMARPLSSYDSVSGSAYEGNSRISAAGAASSGSGVSNSNGLMFGQESTYYLGQEGSSGKDRWELPDWLAGRGLSQLHRTAVLGSQPYLLLKARLQPPPLWGNEHSSESQSNSSNVSRSDTGRATSTSTAVPVSSSSSKPPSSGFAVMGGSVVRGVGKGVTSAVSEAPSRFSHEGCRGAEGFGWGSETVPLRNRELWLEKPAGQFGYIPVTSDQVAFVQHHWLQPDPSHERMKQLQEKRLLKVLSIQEELKETQEKAKQVISEALQEERQLKINLELAEKQANQMMAGLRSGSVRSSVSSKSSLGSSSKRTRESSLKKQPNSTGGGGSGISASNNEKSKNFGNAAGAASAVSASVGNMGGGAGGRTGNAPSRFGNGNLDEEALIQRLGPEERQSAREVNLDDLRMLRKKQFMKQSQEADLKAEAHPDDSDNSKLKALQVLVKDQQRKAAKPEEEVKWIILDFVSFPQAHRNSTQSAVVSGLPFACQWCKHFWSLAKDPLEHHRMQERAWVRLENMLVLRSDLPSEVHSEDGLGKALPAEHNDNILDTGRSLTSLEDEEGVFYMQEKQAVDPLKDPLKKANEAAAGEEGEEEGSEEGEEEGSEDANKVVVKTTDSGTPEVLIVREEDSPKDTLKEELAILDLSKAVAAKQKQLQKQGEGENLQQVTGEKETGASSPNSSLPTPTSQRSIENNNGKVVDTLATEFMESEVKSKEVNQASRANSMGESSSHSSGEKTTRSLNSARTETSSTSSATSRSSNSMTASMSSSRRSSRDSLISSRMGSGYGGGGEGRYSSKFSKAKGGKDTFENVLVPFAKLPPKVELPRQERLVVLYGSALHESGSSAATAGGAPTSVIGGGGGAGAGAGGVTATGLSGSNAKEVSGGEGSSGIINALGDVSYIHSGPETGVSVRTMVWNLDDCLGDALSIEKGDPLNGVVTNGADWPTITHLYHSYKTAKSMYSAAANEADALANEKKKKKKDKKDKKSRQSKRRSSISSNSSRGSRSSSNGRKSLQKK